MIRPFTFSVFEDILQGLRCNKKSFLPTNLQRLNYIFYMPIWSVIALTSDIKSHIAKSVGIGNSQFINKQFEFVSSLQMVDEGKLFFYKTNIYSSNRKPGCFAFSKLPNLILS